MNVCVAGDMCCGICVDGGMCCWWYVLLDESVCVGGDVQGTPLKFACFPCTHNPCIDTHTTHNTLIVCAHTALTRNAMHVLQTCVEQHVFGRQGLQQLQVDVAYLDMQFGRYVCVACVTPT